ncbi:hypothetical protein QOZ80_1BG0083320 [Eleusine coracana subsp. coracana]|nr:hypothetical protein QOZ80_1BG0083320 [Eleusine coracana subsp. coracana]
MVKVETTDESEITEQDALRLTRDLLRIAIHTISHSRGLFPEKYFSVKSAPVIEMKVNVLMPMDAESRRLLDWMDEGVHDALQKKYLKTLLFCICEKKKGLIIEEYTFSFIYHNTNSEEVAMSISCRGLEQNRTVLKSSAAEVTPDQIRSSAREMVQTLIALMRILYPMPEERTILMKLMYNDDYTPEGYEPPFFKHCADNEAIHMWNKSPFKMEMGNFNSKHLVLDLKVKSVLDPSYDNTSIDYVSNQDNECSSTETVVIFVSYLEDSSQHTMKKLIDKMIPEGIVKHSANQRSGHAVTQSESSNKKLLEIAKIVDKMASDANIEHSKLESKYLLRVYRMRESSVMGASSIGADEVLTTQDRQGSRKASVVNFNASFLAS